MDKRRIFKPFESKSVSWNEAQSSCIQYGSDLVSYESKEEMEWVYNHLNWNQDVIIRQFLPTNKNLNFRVVHGSFIGWDSTICSNRDS